MKTGIYVDSENIRLCGGYGMRYDVLVNLAKAESATLLRANAYLAEDRERSREDTEYRQRMYRYHHVLRQCGFRVIKKVVKHFVDDEGILTTKANADMDLAIDALQQARNLDRVMLVSGDGDFVRLVQALQSMGCRVEVIAFRNVSQELKEAADSYLSGYLVPRLLPVTTSQDEDRQRGWAVNYNTDRGFGFMRYYRLATEGLRQESVFFHCSKALDNIDHLFSDPSHIFEFTIIKSQDEDGKVKTEAIDIRHIDA